MAFRSTCRSGERICAIRSCCSFTVGRLRPRCRSRTRSRRRGRTTSRWSSGTSGARVKRTRRAIPRGSRTRFHKKKIFVMGHSWGTVLGAAVAREHPEWLYAYIGVGQVVNVRHSEEIGFEFALKSAKADHNDQAVKDVESLAPYPGAGTV